ncbi:DUF4158 domain-containing protein [Pullulanibacillus sp. KACC 23026]|uniref:DUF4158 domain-containing protein n=1 Tax=Pullulanibacillus sp. KACC 23026 TaxID=3028315 RepID=UPI0023B03F11|nr:DUF4158 domain-containing protein [Pullulanibacillus sp. KACC 23026]WEG14408.1 DUF4158 domain-containing protein [Pullulanibacillus sp. KACC 23026]
MEEIRKHFGFSNFTAKTYRVISRTIFPHALENGNAIYLIRLTLEELRKRKNNPSCNDSH